MAIQSPTDPPAVPNAQGDAGSIVPLVVAGSVLVALTTKLNGAIWFLCFMVLRRAVSDGWFLLISGAVNVGLFVVLCIICGLVFGKSTWRLRCVTAIAALVLHLALWFLINIMLEHELRFG